MKTLEKIIHGIKKVGRKAVAVGTTITMLYTPVQASRLTLEIQPTSGTTSGCNFNIAHHSDAPDGPGWGDVSYFWGAPTPAFDMYENVLGYPWDELSQNAKRANNMDTIINEIDGRELSAPVNAEIDAQISTFVTEDNMIGKKVIGELYDANGTSNPSDDFLVGAYDCWNMHESGQKVYLTVVNGPSHRWVTSFNYNNIADFNNDGYVNNRDFNILADKWGQSGNFLADISGSLGTSDGVIDEHDVRVFANNYLDGY